MFVCENECKRLKYVKDEEGFNTELLCVHSFSEYELQEESRDLEEEQEATGGSEQRDNYTLAAIRFSLTRAGSYIQAQP